jgi:hypothetical protein
VTDDHPGGRLRSASLDEPDLSAVWEQTVAGMADGALSAQQRAWLRLTRPLGLVQDTALLAARSCPQRCPQPMDERSGSL